MNEGWASYWHQRILREMDLTSDEAIEFAKLNAGVVQPSKTSINPYYLGIKIFEDIEERYNNPTEEMKRRGVKPGSGRDKMFEVREIEWDVSFLRNYLNKDLVMREDMYLFQRQGKEYKVIDKEWENVRDQLVNMRTNGGFPYLVVEDGDYLKNGELYIKHSYEGIELDLKYLEKYYHIFISYGEERCIWSRLWRVRALCFLMMGRWCIGSMCEGRTDIGYCVRSFIWNKVKYAILEKGSYIEKWSDLNEQSRDM